MNLIIFLYQDVIFKKVKYEDLSKAKALLKDYEVLWEPFLPQLSLCLTWEKSHCCQ
jgi:hypothetical protein